MSFVPNNDNIKTVYINKLRSRDITRIYNTIYTYMCVYALYFWRRNRITYTDCRRWRIVTHTHAQTHTYRLSIVVVRVWFIVRARPFETPTRTTARTRNNRRWRRCAIFSASTGPNLVAISVGETAPTATERVRVFRNFTAALPVHHIPMFLSRWPRLTLQLVSAFRVVITVMPDVLVRHPFARLYSGHLGTSLIARTTSRSRRVRRPATSSSYYGQIRGEPSGPVTRPTMAGCSKTYARNTSVWRAV